MSRLSIGGRRVAAGVMSAHLWRSAALAAALLVAALGGARLSAAPGAKRPNVVTTIKVDKTGDQAVKPGEVLTYTITATNKGDAVARDVAVNNQVPPATVCIPKSAGGKEMRVQFSLDGGKTYGSWPIRLKDKASGKPRDASPDQITHVKWTARRPLAPGKAVVVSYQVRVK